MIETTVFKTEFVTLYLSASEKGLCGVYFQEPQTRATSSEPNLKAQAVLADALSQLEEYFAGRRREFDLPLDIHGSEFQKKVWLELAKIPFGETCSYIEIAQKLGSKGAVRAVGTANGRNPLMIVLPCHRVIQANGTLGGYAGGLDLKERLLNLEKTAAQWLKPKDFIHFPEVYS